jgi:hypothetical protein
MKNNNFLIEKTVFCLIAILYSFFVLKYLDTEGIFLASFQLDLVFLKKFYSENFQVSDFLVPYGEHGNVAFYFLSIINAKFFNLTNHFYTLVNIFCTSLIAYLFTKNFLNLSFQNKLLRVFGLLSILLILFNPMQGNSYSMENQVRYSLLFTVINIFLIDKILHSKFSYNSIFWAGFVILIAFSIFGTLYSFASIPGILLIICIHYFFHKKNSIVIFFLPLFLLISTVVYLHLFNQIGLKNEAFSFLSIIEGYTTNPIVFFKSFFAFFASFPLGYATIVDRHLGVDHWFIFGFFIFLIQIFSVVLFFKFKMFKYTYAPLAFIGYGFTLAILILIGRGNHILGGDFLWLASDWYWVHTKVSFVSTLIILFFSLSQCFNAPSLYISKIFSIFSIVVILISLSIGTFYTIQRAPSVHAWFKNFEHFLKVRPDDLPIDSNGLTPFYVDKNLASSGLDFLRKYKLSVFREGYDEKH